MFSKKMKFFRYWTCCHLSDKWVSWVWLVKSSIYSEKIFLFLKCVFCRALSASYNVHVLGWNVINDKITLHVCKSNSSHSFSLHISFPIAVFTITKIRTMLTPRTHSNSILCKSIYTIAVHDTYVYTLFTTCDIMII